MILTPPEEIKVFTICVKFGKSNYFDHKINLILAYKTIKKKSNINVLNCSKRSNLGKLLLLDKKKKDVSFFYIFQYCFCLLKFMRKGKLKMRIKC